MSPRNSPKLIMSNHQTSSNLPRNSSKKHLQLQQIPPSLRLAVEKVQVIQTNPTSAKPWSAAVHVRCHGGTVDTEAAAVAVATKNIHSIGHVAPHGRVGFRGLRAPFRSGTADSSGWPGESGPDVLQRPVDQ